MTAGETLRGSAVALGNFDGVHIGHRAIIQDCVNLASKEGLSSVVWTFRTHPQQFFAHSDFSGNIISNEEKVALLEKLKVEYLCPEDFEAVRDLSPSEFCQKILLEQLGAKAVFCGFNFRFGKGGAGDADFLRETLEPLGVRVVVAPPVCKGGDVVSSTRIRNLLSQGEMEEVAELLGRPYSIRFPVEHGKHLGTQMGFPTINQSFPKEYVIPKKGVYVVGVQFDGKTRGGVCNVGCRPTVDREGEVTAETNLFDFSGDLYGKCVTVEFHRFLRAEIRFSSVEELRAEIEKDRDRARCIWKEQK